jgi:hypothetical protein
MIDCVTAYFLNLLTKVCRSIYLERYVLRKLLIPLLCFSFSSLLLEAYLVKADSQLGIRGLDTKVFIGQAYPSGNVYLERLPGEAGDPPPWPKELLILPLGDTKSVLGKKMKASFVKEMKDAPPENNVARYLYLPGAEGMDDGHDSCGIGEIKKVEQYEYLSGDYFRTLVDHCEPNEGLGLYRIDPSKYSFLVLGIDPEIAVADLKLLSGKRPLTAADRQEIIKLKREDKKEAAELGECPTEPRYIDSATQIAEIGLAQGDLRLRVSTYEDPGCAGHLASIYILDLLRRNEVLRNIQVGRHQGAL